MLRIEVIEAPKMRELQLTFPLTLTKLVQNNGIPMIITKRKRGRIISIVARFYTHLFQQVRKRLFRWSGQGVWTLSDTQLRLLQ
jgi:hypothetical protein